MYGYMLEYNPFSASHLHYQFLSDGFCCGCTPPESASTPRADANCQCSILHSWRVLLVAAHISVPHCYSCLFLLVSVLPPSVHQCWPSISVCSVSSRLTAVRCQCCSLYVPQCYPLSVSAPFFAPQCCPPSRKGKKENRENEGLQHNKREVSVPFFVPQCCPCSITPVHRQLEAEKAHLVLPHDVGHDSADSAVGLGSADSSGSEERGC